MTSKERMLCALRREKPDRLPSTTHGWVGYHLNKYLNGVDQLTASRMLGLDASIPCLPCTEEPSPNWRIEIKKSTGARGFPLHRHFFHTPEGTLSCAWEIEETTGWMVEYLVKRPEDVDLIDKYMPIPKVDQAAVVREYDKLGDDGILRGLGWGWQAGCWQNAAEYFGLQPLIMATFRNPQWVHHFLQVLLKKKLRFVEESLTGAKFDLIETGGGAASDTCISPKLHREFCMPYDRQLHDAMHAAGQKVAYHTCGGMMSILDLIVENHCDASETLTPPGMGGNVNAVEVKRRIGDKVCLIGGVNQKDVLDCGTRESIRTEVQRLFREFGPGGGYIMSPSDHFFETPPENLRYYVEAAKECRYS
jgi:uroporphyrinogen-III decarboxylase